MQHGNEFRRGRSTLVLLTLLGVAAGTSTVAVADTTAEPPSDQQSARESAPAPGTQSSQQDLGETRYDAERGDAASADGRRYMVQSPPTLYGDIRTAPPGDDDRPRDQMERFEAAEHPGDWQPRERPRRQRFFENEPVSREARAGRAVEQREFHLRVATHHLRMAGLHEAAERLSSPDRFRQRRYHGQPIEPTISAGTGNVSRGPFAGYHGQPIEPTIPERSTRARPALERRRLNQRFENLDRQIGALGERVENELDKWNDRFAEIEELVEGIQHRDRQSGPVEPADLQVDAEAPRELPSAQRFHDMVRRFNQLLSGQADPDSDGEISEAERDQLLQQAEEMESLLDNLRAVNARQKIQLRQARDELVQSRHMAEQARQDAGHRLELMKKELGRARQRVLEEMRRRQEAEGERSDQPVDAPDSEAEPERHTDSSPERG